MKKTALIQTYTGDGKGTTTASMGLLFRALGRNWKILLVQFLKGDSYTNTSYGELITARKFKENVTIRQCDMPYKIVMEQNKTEEDKQACLDAWNYMLEETKNNHYDLVILDEVLCALCLGFITQRQFLKHIADWKGLEEQYELVLTGRIWNANIYEKIKCISDYMSDIHAIKHPFNKHCPVCKTEWDWKFDYCPSCGRQLIHTPVRKGIEF